MRLKIKMEMFNFLVAETVNSSYLGIKIATFRLKSCLVSS